jgi:hypothetical protein
MASGLISSLHAGQSIQEPKEDPNLYHGLNPKQFVEELDRQVNLKQLINHANDPLFGKPKKAPINLTTISSSKHNSSTAAHSQRNRGHHRTAEAGPPSSTRSNSGLRTAHNESAMRESVMSHTSNMSTATDRLKRILKKQPVHIKGAGFEETPYQRMLIEELINKP